MPQTYKYNPENVSSNSLQVDRFDPKNVSSGSASREAARKVTKGIDMSSQSNVLTFNPISNAASVAHAEMTWEVTTVTPEMAREFLERAHVDLKVQPTKDVLQIKKVIDNGEFHYNAIPIVIGRDNSILDGKKRLRACLEANKPIEAVLILEANPGIYHTIDTHARRSIVAALTADGYEEAGVLVRTVSSLIKYDNGILGREDIPLGWTVVYRVIESNPELTRAVDLATRYNGSCISPGPRGILVAMAMHAGKVNEIIDFLRLTANPKEAPSPMHPAAVLANMIGLSFSARFTKYEQLAFSILAFNDFLEGRDAAGLRYTWNAVVGKKTLKSGTFPGRPELRKLWGDNNNNMNLPKMIGYQPLNNSMFNKETDFGAFISGGLRGKVDPRGETREVFTERLVDMVYITPELAKFWLENNNSRNRKIIREHVKMLATDIMNGQWMQNGQPIVFGTDGNILNGQHRLAACVEANLPIENMVATGVDPNAFSTYDTNKRRALTVAGKDIEVTSLEEAAIRSALRMMIRVDRGDKSWENKNKLSSSVLMSALERHPDIIASAIEAANDQKKHKKLYVTLGTLTFIKYYMRLEHYDLANIFYSYILDGSQIPRGSWITQWRDELMIAAAQTSTTAKPRRAGVLQLLHKGWEIFKMTNGIETSDPDLKKYGNPYGGGRRGKKKAEISADDDSTVADLFSA